MLSASNLTVQLKRLGVRLAIRRFLGLLSLHISSLCACLLLMEGTTHVFPLRESTVGIVLLVILAASTASLALSIAKCLFGRFTPKSMAQRIENAHPQLKDSLNCALELEQKSNLNDIEALLLKRVQDTWRKFPEDFALHEKNRLFSVAALFASLALFILLAACTRIGAQFRFWLHDAVLGQSTGIVILAPQPGDKALIHGDITIQAAVLRWSPLATIHYLDQDNRLQSYPMHPDNESPRVSSFVFYDVTRPVRFKVTTPELTTSWLQVDTYNPPAIKDVKLSVTPQPYTKLPPQSFDDFQDISAVHGDAFALACTVNNGTNVRLLDGNNTSHPCAQNGTAFSIGFPAEHTDTFKVMVTDECGKDAPVAQFTLTVIPDLPPVIERTEPLEDARLTPADALRLSAAASDDFGIASFTLAYRIIGQQDGVLDLAAERNEKEVHYSDFWDIQRFNLQPGDTISCILIAKDNRPTAPNITRTEPFFISIIPNVNEIQADGDAPGQEEKIDLSDLIAESKRIIRMTFDLQYLDNPPQQDMDDALTALHDLALEVAKRQVTMQKAAKVPALPPPFAPLFAQCLEQLEQADEPLRQNNFQDSITHQENALAALLKMDCELLKNQAKSNKAKGKNKKDGQPQENEQKQPEQEQQNEEEQKNDTARLLQEAIDKLQDIIRRQDAANASIKRNDTPLAQVVPTQSAIRSDTNDVEQSLNNLDEAANARASLQDAKNEMGGIASACRNRERQTAAIHGARALHRLTDALNTLERLLQKAESNAVRQLAKQAQALADKQRQAADESQALQKQKNNGTLPEKQHSIARNAQDDLRKQTEKLQKKLRDTANALEQTMPDTARQLRSTADDIEHADTKGKQKKAANALLYKRFDKAADSQRNASEDLDMLAQQLKNTAENMPDFTIEELKRHLEQLQKMGRQAMQAQGNPSSQQRQQQLQQLKQQLQAQTGDLAAMLKDKRLAEISQKLQNGSNPEATARAAQDLLQDIRAAMDITVEHILKLDQNRALQLNRESVTPPDKYRRLVQEYFKELGK